MMSNVASKHVGELAIKVLLTLGLTFGLSLVLPTSPAVATTGDDVAAAQQKVTAAQQKLAAAQAEVDRLSQLPQKDAWDFYASLPNGMGEEALTVLNQNNKKGSTHRGDAKDSTSLDNMWQAVQWLERCNAIRSKDGLAALKVNITMMAVAQVNTNYSTNFNNGHSQQFNAGENLAWGWAGMDPFDGWYYDEKQVYDWKQVGLTLDQVRAQGLKLPSGYVPTASDWQDGHYLNVVRSSYIYTGFAVAQYTYANSPYPCTYGQTFTGSGNTSNLLYTKDQPFTLNKTLESAAMTVADYKALLKDFIDEAKKDSPEMIAAKKTLSSAQAELAMAKTELEKAISNTPKTQSLSVSKLSKSYAPSELTAKGKLAKAQSFTVKATGAVGKVVYKKLSGSKYVAVNSSGKVTVKKGTPKGTYSIKVRVSAGATGSYKASSIVKTVKVVVGDQTVKLGKSSVSVKQTKVKKKAQTLKVAAKTSSGKISSAKNISTNKVAKKFSVKKASSKQITVKVPKGTKKGTYLLKVQIKAPKAAKCAAVTKTVSLKVVVK